MNISTYIDLRFGGAGSGCVPEVAEEHGTRCGRPSGRGTNGRDPIWKQHVKDYAKSWYEGESDEERATRLRKRNEWEHAAKEAWALGKATTEELEERGLLFNSYEEKSGPLPSVLYHVTTNATAVQREGLKSRYELRQDQGVGLGGGDDTTVSFTDSLDIAVDIRRALFEARAAVRGDFSIEKMIRMAKKGGWLEDVRRYMKTSHGLTVEGMLSNTKTETSVYSISKFGNPPDDKHQWRPSTSEHQSSWITDGKKRYALWDRPMTQNETLEMRFNLYRVWAAFRQEKGGPEYPLFFLSDYHTLANTNPSDIKVLKFKPRRGVRGYRVSSLGEWRTATGKAVKLVGVL